MLPRIKPLLRLGLIFCLLFPTRSLVADEPIRATIPVVGSPYHFEVLIDRQGNGYVSLVMSAVNESNSTVNVEVLTTVMIDSGKRYTPPDVTAGLKSLIGFPGAADSTGKSFHVPAPGASGPSYIVGQSGVDPAIWTLTPPSINWSISHLPSLAPNSTGMANDINSSNQIVGQSNTAGSETHAVLWSLNGSIMDLGTLGGTFSSANAINPSGVVVGISSNASFVSHPFMWSANMGMMDLGLLPGTSTGNAEAINASGHVVGYCVDSAHHAFFYNGTMVSIGTLGGNNSYAKAINASDMVVGQAQLANGTFHAFVWSPADGMQDLNTLSGNASPLIVDATSIDDRGDIAGVAQNATTFFNQPIIIIQQPSGNSTGPDPSISQQPANATVTAPASAKFTVTATGTAPLKYQWSFNGKKISGATKSTYAISKTTAASAGAYTVTVSNASGNTTSNPAILTILTKPVIATQPKAASVKKGATVKFTVKATGSSPLSYQWQLNSQNLTNTGNVSGVTTTTLTITAATTANQGTYRVLVTNPAGSINSSAVKLTVK